MTITKIKNQTVLLDSNIIVYSLNTISSHYKTALQFIKSAASHGFSAVIAHQNILESTRVLTHPKFDNPMSIQTTLRRITELQNFCRVIHPFHESLTVVAELIHKYKLKSNQIFDAYLVATMLTNGVKIIATDNVKDLGIFKEIEIFNPF